ncbi:MAG: c-type cytochrome biogenesis protein CcsB [Candidatus Coatesbacteria bacterium]|nr:MAG: c-type cytochrome biogenesis protein CcsB [Candidatus Coatesbacteria bacterium]RLC43743.1 MAG: c-type cytochrome biogenesis protein CcsB [Candidatus Coatesbacteria bacterium]
MKRWIIVFLLFVFFSFAFSTTDYQEGYSFLKENVDVKKLKGIPIKGDRVELWENFADYVVKVLRDGGEVKSSDIGEDPSLFLLHLSLDEEYRDKARLLYIARDEKLGIDSGRWVSLDEFESGVMLDIQNELSKMPTSAKKSIAEERARVIAYRASILKTTELGTLWLIPPERGIEWDSISSSGDEELIGVLAQLESSYQDRDDGSFKEAFNCLFKRLIEYSDRLPAWRLTVDRLNNLFNSITVAFFLFLIASLMLFVYLPIKKKWLERTSFILAITGFAFLTWGLTLRSLIGWHLPVTNMFEYLSLMSWAVVLFALIFHRRFNMPVISAIGLPISAILIVIGSIFPTNITDQLIPALKSYWLTIHVVLASLGEAAFAVGFIGAIMYLIKAGDEERARMYELLSYRAIAIGYPLFTIGALVAGAIWAQRAWGVWWDWDPKETSSFIVWLVATAYLHARLVSGWRGRRSAILAILIFVLSIFTLFANLIFGGLHSYEG